MMGIAHVVSSFALIFALFGVLNGDDQLQARTNLFIREQLVPALKTALVTNINYDRIRLCYCSTEAGCHVSTNGWVGGLLQSLTNETEMFKHTCYTDGSCYQTVQTHPLISSFGCMDKRQTSITEDFQAAAVSPCLNRTTGSHPALWICCNDSNFCANTTTLHLPPMPSSPLPSWIIGVVFCVGVLCVAVRFYRTKCIPWPYQEQKNAVSRDQEQTRTDSESSQNNESVVSGTEEGLTLSTVLNECPTQSAGDCQYPKRAPPGFLSMMKFFDEQTGSGSGTGQLAQMTIGHQIKRMNVVGSGRFGYVQKGVFNEEFVAVKVFDARDEASFKKEVLIYETTMLRHPYILRYIGNDQLDLGMKSQKILVTEYHENGSLYDYLQTHVITLETCFSLLRSAAGGLAFLHTAVSANTANSKKPPIAHRDIKSRNIMVRADRTCAIGDLGLSLSLENSTGKVEGVTRSKCGTVRYLAPEILNETMPCDAFESYMMADVYAFSLVMWETLCRVEDGKVTARDPATVIPYFEWAPKDPDETLMREIVCEKKLRPVENPEWRSHPNICTIMEVISTSWNTNPTARFSAKNIRSRLESKLEQIKKEQMMVMAAMRERDSPRKIARPRENFELANLAGRGKVHDQEALENELRAAQSPVVVVAKDTVDKVESRDELFRDDVKDPLIR